MQSFHDSIKKEVSYAEILSDEMLGAPGAYEDEKYADAIIQLEDGSLMVCFSIKAADANFSDEISKERRNILSAFVAGLGNNFELFYEWRKVKSSFKYKSHEESMKLAAREIEIRRKAEFTSADNLLSRTDIALVLRIKEKNFFLTKDVLDTFLQTAGSLKSVFENAECEVKILKNEELLAFLKYSLDFSEQRITDFKGAENISSALLTATYEAGRIPLEINDGRKNFVRCFSITALPSYTFPDFFSFCSYLDFEFRLCVKYRSYDIKTAEDKITHKRKSFKNSLFSLTQYMYKEAAKTDISDEYSHSALNGKQQCDKALELMGDGMTSAGDLQITFMLHAENEEELEKISDELKQTVQKQGMLLKTEKLGNTLCFLSCITANSRYYSPLFVMSSNFADILHLGSPDSGAEKSQLLIKRTGSDTPFIYAKNMDGSVYHFSLSGVSGEKGHTFITGPTGSGKSALLALFAAQWQKYRSTRCVIIDRDMSSLKIVSGSGGKIFYPGNDGTRFQPLKNAVKNLRQVNEFIKAVCFISDVPFTAELKSEVAEAARCLEAGKETVSAMYSVLKGINPASRLLDVLLPYVSGGEFQELFDSNEDSFGELETITMIETNKILKTSVSEKNTAIPAFIYLFSKLEEKFEDGLPTVLIIDEGWKILKHEIFSSYLEEWIKTLRKKNVDVIFSVTNLSDIIGTPVAETILSNTETKIFFKDKNAADTIQAENYRKTGLSEYQIYLLSKLPDFCPMIIQNGKTSVVDFRMKSQLEFLITDDDFKRKFLCKD